MKLNFSVDEFKDMLNAGEFDEIFFDTLDDLGLKIRNDYYRSKESIFDIKKIYSGNSDISVYKNLKPVEFDKKTLDSDLQNCAA